MQVWQVYIHLCWISSTLQLHIFFAVQWCLCSSSTHPLAPHKFSGQWSALFSHGLRQKVCLLSDPTDLDIFLSSHPAPKGEVYISTDSDVSWSKTSSQRRQGQNPWYSSMSCSRIFPWWLFFFSIYIKLVQGYDPLTFVLYPHCTIYVLDLPIKCNTLMLNFSRAEYVREGGQGSLLSAHQLLSVKTWAVGLWLKDHRETLISVGYWASSQGLNFPFVSFKVDTPQPITLESDFTSSTVPSSASKELNSFVRFFCQLFGPQVFS